MQTTNRELRCKMLHNRFAGEKLAYLDRFFEGHVEMNGQIVCCKGVNDGAELERSIRDLSRYLPFMRSVSVVPAGLTKYREGLYPLELYTKEEAEKVIELVESFQERFYEEYGLHFIHASDEWYITAEREFPEEERYDGYIQLENGVGMMRLFIEEFEEALIELQRERKDSGKRTLTIATGKLAFHTVRGFAERMMELYPELTIHVYAIRNDFFGEMITVSGLITGQDLVNQLLKYREEGAEPGEVLVIPSNMLRMGEQVFLDDMTVQEAEEALGMRLVPAEMSGWDFIRAVMDEDYSMERENDGIAYVRGYPEGIYETVY